MSIEALEQIIDKFASARAEFKKQAQEHFNVAVKALFELNPALTAIHWVQYTPYFNDGEPCTFTLGDLEFTNCPIEELPTESSWVWDVEERDDGVWFEGYYNLKSVARDGINKDSIAKFATAFNKLDDILETAFGDHVSITIDRNSNLTVEEYEHD